MSTQTIRCWAGDVIYEGGHETLRQAVGAAVRGGAYLAGANLHGADLAGAYLARADLAGADLAGARLAWDSHALLSHLLLRAAGKDIERRKVAGLVAVSTDWCWDRLLAVRDPLRDWALDVLGAYVIDGDDAPSVLREWAAAARGKVEVAS